tara:strand:+ start:22930 stop:23097 length:168 start_codon:yes stop_codon:yes gene_type:complete
MAAAGGAIPGGFFMARQAGFAGVGKFCPATLSVQENCIQNRKVIAREYGRSRPGR